MKSQKILSLIIILLCFVNYLDSYGQSANSETVVIKTNIYCDHCKECGSCGGRIEKDLGFDKGIKLVRLDEKLMTVTVTYNPKKTNAEEIRKTISMYGYDADSIKADAVAYSKLDECCKK